MVILYLQRASDAKRSYGSVLFSETVYRGLSLKSFLGFDETFIEEALRSMYSKHEHVDPREVSYIEMDANGVKVRIILKRPIIYATKSLISSEIFSI